MKAVLCPVCLGKGELPTGHTAPSFKRCHGCKGKGYVVVPEDPSPSGSSGQWQPLKLDWNWTSKGVQWVYDGTPLWSASWPPVWSASWTWSERDISKDKSTQDEKEKKTKKQEKKEG
jgi:hypothetical protein